MDAKMLIEKIAAEAATNRNEPKFVRVMHIHDIVRQGDVYVECIVEPIPGKLRGHNQVAVGNTVGSRHVATCGVAQEKEGGRGKPSETLKVYELSPTRGFGMIIGAAGVYVHSTERWTLTHPQHANITFPAGWYRVGYQLDMNTQRAVLD